MLTEKLPAELWTKVVEELLADGDLQGLVGCRQLGIGQTELHQQLQKKTVNARQVLDMNIHSWLESFSDDLSYSQHAASYYLKPFRPVASSELSISHNTRPAMETCIENPRLETSHDNTNYVGEILACEWLMRHRVAQEVSDASRLCNLGPDFQDSITPFRGCAMRQHLSKGNLPSTVTIIEAQSAPSAPLCHQPNRFLDRRWPRDQTTARNITMWSAKLSDTDTYDIYSLLYPLQYTVDRALLPAREAAMSFCALKTYRLEADSPHRAALYSLQFHSFPLGLIHERHYSGEQSHHGFITANARIVNGRAFWLDDHKLMMAVRYSPCTSNPGKYAKDEFIPDVHTSEVFTAVAPFSEIIAANSRYLVVAYGAHASLKSANTFALVDAVESTVKIYRTEEQVSTLHIICGLVNGELVLTVFSISALNFILQSAISQEAQLNADISGIFTSCIPDIPVYCGESELTPPPSPLAPRVELVKLSHDSDEETKSDDVVFIFS